MNTTNSGRTLEETAEAISDLINQGTQIGRDLFDSLTNNQATTMLSQLLKSIAPQFPQFPQIGRSSCNIPPPCWMPRALGDVVSHVCPGGTATIRIRVTNCSVSTRDIRVRPAGKPEDIKEIKVEPASLSLGPMERGSFVVSVAAPADAGVGQEREFLLWVNGCLTHYLRWTVRVAKRGADCCHEVDVEDCPDYTHHWYDHFYCERPCQPNRDNQ